MREVWSFHPQIPATPALPAADRLDLGAVPVPWWPYRPDFPTPRAGKIPDVRSGADTGKQKLPQDYTEGFQKTLQKGMLKIGPTVVKWKAANLFSRQHPTSLEIQDDLPATISTRSDRNRPGMSRTDAFFADRMLNGFNTTLLIGRDRQDPSKLRMKIQWGEVPSDGSHDLADVDVTFGADADGEVLPVAITLVNRVAGEAPGPWARVDRRTFTPPAGATAAVASAAADWEAAKRVVRVQYLL